MNLIATARAAMHETAKLIRALPDHELVALVMGGEMRDEGEPKPAKRSSSRSRKAKPAAEPPTLSTEQRKASVLEHLRAAGDFVRGADIARELGEETSRVADSLRALALEGLAESNGKRGLGSAYRAVGRQTRTRSAQKPAKGSDEEEGAGVEPPKPDPEPAPEPKPARMLGPIRKPEPELMKLSICAPASPVPAQPRAALSPVAPIGRLGAVNCDDEIRRLALEEIAAREPVRWGDVVQVLGIDSRHGRRSDVLVALLKRGAVHARGIGLDAILAVHPELLPSADDSGVFRLPMFLDGPGERRDNCSNYDGCLDRFDRAHRHAHAAHCPKGCASFTPTPAHVRHAIAMTGGESALARAAESK